MDVRNEETKIFEVLCGLHVCFFIMTMYERNKIRIVVANIRNPKEYPFFRLKTCSVLNCWLSYGIRTAPISSRQIRETHMVHFRQKLVSQVPWGCYIVTFITATAFWRICKNGLNIYDKNKEYININPCTINTGKIARFG